MPKVARVAVTEWARDRGSMSQIEPERGWVNQSEPEIKPIRAWDKARVSQWELDWAKESKSKPERSWLTSTLLTAHHARQWVGDWLTNRDNAMRGRLARVDINFCSLSGQWSQNVLKTVLLFNTELLLQAYLICTDAKNNISSRYKKKVGLFYVLKR